jgi:hypothetical protein
VRFGISQVFKSPALKLSPCPFHLLLKPDRVDGSYLKLIANRLSLFGDCADGVFRL